MAIRLLVSFVAIGAGCALIYSAPRLTDLVTISQLCLLVLVAGSLRYPIGPARVGHMASFVLMAVYMISGPAAAVVVAGVGSVVQGRDVPLIKRVFSSSQRVLSAAAGSVVYTLLDGPVGPAVFDHTGRAILAVSAAGFVHQVVNGALVGSVLWLERGSAVAGGFVRHDLIPIAIPTIGYRFLGLLMAVAWLGGLGVIAGLIIIVPLAVARWAYAQDEAERKAQAATMRAFIQVIETKDFYTRGHSERVSQGVGMLGRQLRLNEHRQHALEHAGLLHDVGKVGVPTSVIRKPGRLDDTEMDAIRLHPARGVELIGDIPFLEEVKSAVLHHHEKYDGTGYPAGLSGTNIPYFARIIGIVDAFDSLTSTRSYRPARSVEETLAILVKDRYTHFDPELVDSFVNVIEKEGWRPEVADQPVPDGEVQATVDHDDLSLGSGGGASGSAAGPA